jgi:hypothetical protein
MFKRLLVLLGLCPSLAMGQGLSATAPGATGGGKVLASYPLTTSGALITEDAGTVAHVYFTGTSHVDTNYALQSNTLTTGTNPTSPWAASNVTVDNGGSAPAIAGGGIWSKVTATGVNGALYYAGASVPSGTTLTSSIWASKAAGVGGAGITVGASGWTAGGCSCTRSDGGSCTATVTATHWCLAEVADLGTTPIRLTVTGTGVAVTAINLNARPALSGDSSGTTLFTGAQIEAGSSASPLIPSLGTATATDRALVDTKGNSWTQNGTVPQVTANPFTTTRYGAGPFSTSNYYSLGAGADVLDFAGDFTVCAVLGGSGGGYAINAQSSSANTGHGAAWNGSTNYVAYFGNTSSLVGISSSSGAAAAGPNVACYGRSGTTGYSKINLGATGSGSTTGYAPATTQATWIGVRKEDGFGAYASTIYEVYATTSPWSEATVTAIQQKVLGHFDGSSALAVTRTTNATYVGVDGQTVWTAAPGVARITGDGLLVEPARQNVVLNSTTHPKAAEATASIGTGLFQARHAGAGTMTLVAGSATVTGLSCTAVAAGTVCTGTVTVAGTLSITTTAGTTRAQVELGAYPSSWIDTAGTAVNRNADQVSATVPAVPSKWCVAVTAKTVGQAWPNAGNTYIWSMGVTGAANSVRLDDSTYLHRDSVPNLRYYSHAAFAAGADRLVACNTSGVMTLTQNGTPMTLTPLGETGTGLFSPAPTTLNFGDSGGGTTSLGGYLKNLKICVAKSAKECK